jgi:hypothetical protein
MNLIKRWHLNTKKEKILVGFVVLAILFRLLIAVEMPVKVYMQAGYDDALSINQALNILAGKWLGPYNAGILTKGLSFTFFLLVNHFSRLSYPLFLCLIDMLAAVAMVKALAPLIKNKYLSAFGFLFLIYSPATLASDFSLRIYRNSLVFAAVLFVLAGILGLYLRRKDTIHQRLPWSILLMAATRRFDLVGSFLCRRYGLYTFGYPSGKRTAGWVTEGKDSYLLAVCKNDEKKKNTWEFFTFNRTCFIYGR